MFRDDSAPELDLQWAVEVITISQAFRSEKWRDCAGANECGILTDQRLHVALFDWEKFGLRRRMSMIAVVGHQQSSSPAQRWL
jgi:hypothetical protein